MRGCVANFILVVYTNLCLFFCYLQGQYSSAPSTLSRHPACAVCRSASAESGSTSAAACSGSVRNRFTSVGTSTRIDRSSYEMSASHPPARRPKVYEFASSGVVLPNRRPFQNVEKTCSVIMALLFLLFNAIYWPWLLRDEDFDYAKFSATHQEQLKLWMRYAVETHWFWENPRKLAPDV